MLVNLTDVFTNEGQVQELAASYDADIFTNQYGTFSIKEKSPVVLKLSNIGRSRVLVQGTVHITFALACDRCLQDVDYTFDLSLIMRLSHRIIQVRVQMKGIHWNLWKDIT